MGLVSNGINTGIRYLRPLTYGCGALVRTEGCSMSAAIIRARRSNGAAGVELLLLALPHPHPQGLNKWTVHCIGKGISPRWLILQIHFLRFYYLLLSASSGDPWWPGRLETLPCSSPLSRTTQRIIEVVYLLTRTTGESRALRVCVSETPHWPGTVKMFPHDTSVPANWLKSDCMKLPITASTRRCRRGQQARAAAGTLRLSNITRWRQRSEISGDSGAAMMTVCVALLCRMKNDAARSPFHRRQTVYFQVSFLMNTQFILRVGEEGRGGGRATAAGGLRWDEGGPTIGDSGIKKGGKQMSRVRKWRKPLLSSAAHEGPAGGPLQIKGSPVRASPVQNVSITTVDTKNMLRVLLYLRVADLGGILMRWLTQSLLSGQRVTLRYTHKTSLWDLERGSMPSFYSKIGWGPTGALVKPVLVPRKHLVPFRMCPGLTGDSKLLQNE